MSYEQFQFMGLSKLTQDEYYKFLSWASERSNQVRVEGMAAGRKAQESIDAIFPTYSCGPSLDETTASKVRVFIQDPGDNPAELMSEFRQKLRNIPDVQIVFSEKEADLVLSLIGYEMHMGGRAAGYAVSLIVSTPCTSRSSANEFPFSIGENHLLETGSEVKPLVDDLVASVDAKNIESVRKDHADLLKAWNKPKGTK